MTKYILLALMSLILVSGCRAVLDDNPPKEFYEDDKTSDTSEPDGVQAQSAAVILATSYLSSHDPKLFDLDSPSGTVTLIGARNDDGTVKAIEQVTFKDDSGSRLLLFSGGEVFYRPTKDLMATFKFSNNKETVTALVYEADKKSLRSHRIILDQATVHPAFVNGVKRSLTTTQPAMASYQESSGYFVAQPIACGLPITKSNGTRITLSLAQGDTSRQYPIKLDGDGVWRSSVQVPGSTSSAFANKEQYSQTLYESVARNCRKPIHEIPGSEPKSADLSVAARSLARFSEYNSAVFPKIESDISQLCDFLEMDSVESSVTVNDDPFVHDEPIEATMTMAQGINQSVISKIWIKYPGEDFVSETIGSNVIPLIVDVNHTEQPPYAGDPLSLSVQTQCSDGYIVDVDVKDSAGAQINSLSEFIKGSVVQPQTTEFGNLVVADGSSRYSFEVSLKSGNGEIIDDFTAHTTTR